MTGIKLIGKTGKDGRQYEIRKVQNEKGIQYGLQSVDQSGIERSTAFESSLVKIVEKFNKA